MIEAPKRFEENPSEATEVKKNGTERLGMDQDGVAKKIAAEILLTKENVELGNVTNPGLANGSTLATDLKLITISGNYIYAAGATNAPTAAAGYAQVVITDANNRLVVTSVASGDGIVHIYHMQMVAGVWTAWSQAYELNYAKLNYVQFNESIAAVPTAVGSIYWDDDAKTVSLVLPDGVIAQIPEELYVNVVRDSAAPNPIVNGTPVYTIGEQGQRPRVGVARADDPAKILVTGIATHDIANQGRITTFGLIRAVPLSVKPSGETWVAGNYLWLATTGGMTNVEPSSPMPNVRLGLITNVTGSASFDMLVYIRSAMGMYDLYDVNGDLPAEGSELSFDFTHGYWKATNRLTQAEADILLKLNKSDVSDNYDGGTTKALSAEKGKDLNARVLVLEGRKFGLYGFKKHKLTGACTPLYDSVALGPVPVIRGSRPAGFVNPYKLIRIFNWRSCLMDTKQRILAYHGQAGYGTPTHDSQSYEVEIPAAYINQWEDEYYTYRVMSEAPQLPGMFIPGCFRDNRGREMPFAYVDKYRRGVLNGYSVSRPDVLPEVSITLNAAELKAEAVDTDALWTGCPEELDWYITFVGEIMACNTNSQAAYGQGMSSMPYSASHTVVSVTTDANTIIVSNSTANAFKVSMNVKLGSALGSGQTFADRFIQSITDNGDGTSTVVVDGAPFTTVVGYILHAHRQVTTSYEAEQIGEDCGFILHNGRSESQVENWINGIAGHGGNVYEFSFGLLRYDNYVYLCHDRYQFKHNDDPRTNASFKNVGFFEDESGDASGWIKNMVLVGEAPYVMEWIQELGAGSTTHYADVAYYLNATYRGTRIVRRRFFWNAGSDCGRRGLAGYNVLSASSWIVGWRASPSKLPKQAS